MNKKRMRSLFTAMQVLLVVLAGVFTFSYFNTQPQVTAASGCTVNPPYVWACYHYTTTINNNVDYNVNDDPTSLQVGQKFTFTTSFKVNNKEVGGWENGDIFGISIAQIMQSPTGTNIDPTNTAITNGYINNNRQAGNDLQQAVDTNGNAIASGSSWDTYNETKSGCEVWDANYTKTTESFSCTFTPQHPGFFQVDFNSYDYYSIGGAQQDCARGYCGPEAALFIKVVNAPTPTPTSTPTPTATPTPTSTPTATPTPIPVSLSCSAAPGLTLTDNATGKAYTTATSDVVAPLKDSSGNDTNQSRIFSGVITGSLTGTNASALSVKWGVNGLNESESNAKTNSVNVTGNNLTFSGTNYTDTMNFQFGPYDDNNTFDASDIPASNQYQFSIVPSFYLGGKLVDEKFTSCSGTLVTTSIGKVLGTSTQADVTISKTLITNDNPPILVGNNAVFKLVISNNGTEDLTSVKFNDNFQDNNVVKLLPNVDPNAVSPIDNHYDTVFETNSGVNSATQDLNLTVNPNDTTNPIDLATLTGFKTLAPGDSFTIMLTFDGQAAGSNLDTGIVNAVSSTGTNVNALANASVTFSPVPVSPNTGAPSLPIFLAAGFLGLSLLGKKFVLNSLFV
jgi:hypothetical protein